MREATAHIPRVALAHDYLLVMRGAERTFAAMAELFPRSPIHTLLYDEQGTDGRLSGRMIETSPLQRLGVGQGSFRRLLPLYPWAAERMRPESCDVVLSSSSAFAHGLRPPVGSVHVCYCHAPFRYAWYEEERALQEAPVPLRPLLRLQLRRMRRWDLEASCRVDAYIANSELTRERIKRYYGRESTVIHPPVETHRFSVGEPGETLLVVGEVVRHKRVQVALEGARRAGMPIQIVGVGPDCRGLSEAYPEAEFLGRVSDEELIELYQQALAIVVAGREEFGITAVEGQAAGRPVIAAAAGGALETVIEGKTGLLATLDDPDSFAAAMRAVDRMEFDPAVARENAARFSVIAFREKLGSAVRRIAASGGPFEPQLL